MNCLKHEEDNKNTGKKGLVRCYNYAKLGHIARNDRAHNWKPINNIQSYHEGKQEGRLAMVKTFAPSVKVLHLKRNKKESCCKIDYMIIDGGASAHVVFDENLFQNLEEVNEVELELADGSNVTCKNKGVLLVGTGTDDFEIWAQYILSLPSEWTWCNARNLMITKSPLWYGRKYKLRRTEIETKFSRK